jgi:hypothetical protein
MYSNILQTLAAVQARSAESDVITIQVQTLSGWLPPIAFSAEATVQDVKLHLQSLNADFGFDRQKLFISDPSIGDDAAGVALQNHRTLQSYDLSSGTNTNVVLVMESRSEIEEEVSIDGAPLNDTQRFAALQANRDLHAIAIHVSSICRHGEPLIKLLIENQAVRSVKISGRWTEEHLQFCAGLVARRPDIDIRFVVTDRTGKHVVHRVVDFCQSIKCSFLDLRENAFCVALPSALKSMSSLQYLDLGSNGIKPADCVSLASALKSMSSLQHLNLSCNRIGKEKLMFPWSRPSESKHSKTDDAGCVALSPALKALSSLQSLDLSSNGLGASCFVSLLPALQSLSSLQSLNLSDNPIGNGFVSFDLAARSMTSLTSVNFSKCCNDDENRSLMASALKSMASALQSMTSLQT